MVRCVVLDPLAGITQGRWRSLNEKPVELVVTVCTMHFDTLKFGIWSSTDTSDFAVVLYP